MLLDSIIDFMSKYVGNLKEDELQAIIDRVHHSSYKKSELIYKQGEIPNMVSFLTKGSVRSYYLDADGNEHTVGFSFADRPIVPIGSFLEQIPSGLSVVALENVELVWTSRQEYNSFLESFPRFELGVAKLLGEYLVSGNEQLKLMRIRSSRERYETLCEMRPEVMKKIPLKYIASYLGMALETLSRIRAGKL